MSRSSGLCSHGLSQKGTSSGSSVSRTNGAFITDTESPRAASKPTASFTSASMRVRVAASSAVITTLPFSPVRGTWSTSTAAVTRRTRPAGCRVCCSVRSISKLRVALLLVSTGAAGLGAAAAFGPGGVLLVAPGTPSGPVPATVFWLTCSLRILAGSLAKVSRASSVTEKSMSTATSAFTRPGPVSGSSSSRMRSLKEVSSLRTRSNWAALSAASLFGSLMVSMRPLWSTTVTRSGARSGMDDDTRCTMASTWLRSSMAPERRSSTTDALATSRWRVKALGLGMARCTRASRTGRRVVMVRTSSVSSACW